MAEARELGVRGHPGLYTETHVCLGVNLSSDSGREPGRFCWLGLGSALLGIKGQRQGSEITSGSGVTDRNQRPHRGTEGHTLGSRVRVESTKKGSHRSRNIEGKGQTLGSETGSNYVGQASSNSLSSGMPGG